MQSIYIYKAICNWCPDVEIEPDSYRSFDRSAVSVD